MSNHIEIASFRKTVEALLTGEFICPIKYPGFFRYLADEENAESVSSYVSRMGFTLGKVSESENSAWVLFHSDIDSGDREMEKAIRKEFQENQINVCYFKWIGDGLRKESISMGDRISLRSFIDALKENRTLRESISVAIGKESDSEEDLCRSIIKTLTGRGYLSLSDDIESIYIVTGKIDYFYAMNDFLSEYYHLDRKENEETPLVSLMERSF